MKYLILFIYIIFKVLWLGIVLSVFLSLVVIESFIKIEFKFVKGVKNKFKLFVIKVMMINCDNIKDFNVK